MSMMKKGVQMAVAVFVTFILLANLLPTAFTQVFNTTQDPSNGTTANWTGATIDIWNLLPLIAVIVALLVLVAWATDNI